MSMRRRERVPSNRRKSAYQRVIGLSYSEEKDSAPEIVIKESSFAADEIAKIAVRFGIPIVEKPELARGLDNFQEGEEIPQELYEAVAVILNGIEEAKRRQG